MAQQPPGSNAVDVRPRMPPMSIAGTSSQNQSSGAQENLQGVQESLENLQENQKHEKKLPPPPVPFLYNIRILPIALPGIMFALTLSGELLPGVLTIGGLIIYLMSTSGSPRNAVIAYVCTLVAAQLSVLYSALPLIWISIFNFPLLLLLNMFLGLSGGWGLLQFEFFIHDQLILTELIEMGLFTFYPLVSIGLVTWITGYFMSVKYAIYIAIIYGFLLLRTLLKPTRSSFAHLKLTTETSDLVLGNTEIAIVLIVYLGFPCVVFFVSHLLVFFHGDLKPLLELVLVTLLPLFLTTFIQLRGLYEQINVTVKQVSYARIILGIVVLVLTCVVLHQLQFSSAATWLLPAVLLYTLLGFALTREHKSRALNITLTVCIVVVTTFIILQVVPITINIKVTSSYFVTFILVLNIAVSTFCASALGTTKRNSSFFSKSFILHAMILAHTECFFMYHRIYSPYLAAFTAVIETYLVERLRAASKVSRDWQWLACSMHAMKIPIFTLLILNIPSNVIQFKILACYSSIALMLVLAKVLLHEDRLELDIKNVAGYLLCVAAGLFVFLVNVVRPVLLEFVYNVGLLQILLCDIFIACLVSCKLALYNMQQYPNSFVLSGVVLFFSSISLVLQAPAVQAIISPWLVVMLEIALIVHVLCTTSVIKVPNPRLYALVGGSLLGIPFGVTYCQNFGHAPTFLLYATYSSLSIITLILLIIIWRYSIQWKPKNLTLCTQDQLLHGTFATFVALSLVLIGRDVTLLSETMPVWDAMLSSPAAVFCCLLYCTLSIFFRLFCLKWQQEDPFAYKPGLLPTYGNALTIGAYLLALLSNPLPFPEIWNSASSIILLCLQQDERILRDFQASMRPGVIFAMCSLQLLVFSFKHSILWTSKLSVFAVLEMLALPLSIPMLVVMAKVISKQPKYELPEQMIILWAPLPILVFIFGDSYTSWLLAGTSFASGLWLLQQTSFGLQV